MFSFIAAVNHGEVFAKECLNASGAATGLGKPSTPWECRHAANSSMSRLAWANVIRWPQAFIAAVNHGEVFAKECLNASGAATGLGKPSTPCECMHAANRSRS